MFEGLRKKPTSQYLFKDFNYFMKLDYETLFVKKNQIFSTIFQKMYFVNVKALLYLLKDHWGGNILRRGQWPAAMLAVKRSAGAAPEANLRELHHVHLCQVRTMLTTLALKPRGVDTRRPKQEYQWPQKKDLCPPKNCLKKEIYLCFTAYIFQTWYSVH